MRNVTRDDRYRRLEALFHEWVDLDEVARLERLNQLASDEPELHHELAALIGQSSRVVAGERALDDLANTARQISGAPLIPATIGSYRILHLIGSGGMGQVFEGEQSEPVRRRVAIKLSRTGLADELALARFRAERQMLAALDHPNIARIFDAGTHSDGRPWFAMELVDGVPITEWAEAHKLGLRERIELLLPVCDAVQHAHLKGVIHRDLKPGNILVGEQDGKAKPRIIDFGIAKAIDASTGGERVLTRSGELIGTPEYMSPEQASLGAVDIDTRSDVYALGLVLFELLVGDLPITLSQLRRFAFDEMCRRIREDDTPAPSRLVLTQASTRGSLPSIEWARKLRGDLDAVVLKALAKDREQRYASVADFGADLRRFLSDQPVLATPPNWRHRVRKWIKRNRALATGSALALLALAVGTLLAVDGYRVARDAARTAALAQAEAEATAEFMLGLFKAADPRAEPGQDPGARELLSRGVAKLSGDQSSGLAPSVRLRALENLADASWALGDYSSAQKLFTEALDGRQAESPVQAHRLAFVYDRLGAIARDQGDLPVAAEHHQASLAVLQDAGQGRTAEAARAQNHLAIVLRRQGELHAAGRAYAEVFALTEALEPGPSARLASVWLNLGAVHHDLGDYTAAINAQRKALDMFHLVLPANHPNFAVVYNNLSLVERNAGRLHAALESIRQARANEEINLPAQHPDRADSMHNEATIRLRLGQLDAADALLAEAYALLSATLGPDHPRSWVHSGSRAEILLLRGRHREAAEALQTLLVQIPESASSLKQRLVLTRKLVLALRGMGDAAVAQAAERHRELAERAARPADQALAALLLALLALDAGSPGAAAEHYKKSLALDPSCVDQPCVLDQSSTLVLRAHYVARVGTPEEAFRALEFALEHRAFSAALLASPDLAPLRGHPQWSSMEQGLRKRLAPPAS